MGWTENMPGHDPTWGIPKGGYPTTPPFMNSPGMLPGYGMPGYRPPQVVIPAPQQVPATGGGGGGRGDGSGGSGSGDPPVAIQERGPVTNYSQPQYAGLERLYGAQADYQKLALEQAIKEAAAGNPYLANMLQMLQYSMNEDQMPRQERQALNAQREKNLQQSLSDYGPGQKEYLLSGNPQGMGQRMRDLDKQQRDAAQDATMTAYQKGYGIFKENAAINRPLAPMPNAQGRVTNSYNNQSLKPFEQK